MGLLSEEAAADQGAANNSADEAAAAAATAEANEAGAGDAAGAVADSPAGEPAPVTAIPAEGFADAAARDAFLENVPEEQLDAALSYYREHGEWPTAEAGTKEAPKAAEPAKTQDEGGGPKADEGDAETALEPFKFTENADPDTFKAEEAAWRETVEISPELNTVLTVKDNRIAELETKVNENPLLNDPTAVEHIAAFDKLVTFVHDPEINKYVPDTSGVLGLLDKEYSNELPQLIQDVNSAPSTKYQGYTRLQEFMRDTFELSADAMAQINYFLVNKGQIPFPSFVPAGIHTSLTDAYWSTPEKDRSEIELRVEKAQFTLHRDPDATDVEKQAAADELRSINFNLDRAQKGIDATKNGRQNALTQADRDNESIRTAGVEHFYSVTTGLLNQFSEKFAKSLSMLDETGSDITGLAYATLIEKALTNDPFHSKMAQDKLKEKGIVFDWSRGRAALDNLDDQTQKLANLKFHRANQRAIDNAEREVLATVKSLEGLNTELGGVIVARVVNGNANKVAKQMAAAPKQQAAKRKITGDAAAGAAPTTWEELSYEEGEKRLADLRLKRATQGDFGGFQ